MKLTFTIPARLLTCLVLTIPACGGGGSSPGAPAPIPTAALTPAPAPVPLYTHTGSGDTVFDLPQRITRVRIDAAYSGYSSNFVVHIAGDLVVNELLGTGWGPVTFTGTYLIRGGGVVEITDSTGVSWTFTEVRP